MTPASLKAMSSLTRIVVLVASAFVFIFQLRADQNITLRTGNGSIGSTDSQIHVLPFNTTGDITPTPQNFSDAQVAPHAYVVTPYVTYIPSLPADPTAKWIAVNTSLPQGSALFAIPFQVTDPSITSATLDIHFSVDNAVNGVFFNGNRISGNSYDGDYHAQYEFVRDDIGPLLIPNSTNWLYVNMSDYGGLAAIIFSASITIKGGGSSLVVPSSGGNTGYVSLDITGKNFSDGPATVVLHTSGQPEITGIAPQVISATEIQDTFNLQSAEPGSRDITVYQNDKEVLTYPDAFIIESGGSAELSLDIIGPSRIRGGREGTFYLELSNNGSIDAPFVNLQAQAKAGTTTTNQSALQRHPSRSMAADILPGCSVGPVTIYSAVGLPQLFPINCTPQGSACYSLEGLWGEEGPSKDCSDEKARLDAAQSAVTELQKYLSQLNAMLVDLVSEFNSTCRGSTNTPRCFILALQIAETRSDITATEAQLEAATYALARARAEYEICLAEKQAQGKSIPSPKITTVTLSSLTSPAATSPASGASSLQFCGVTALDPNAKIGVSGVGNLQYVRGALPLAYTIQFENLPTAGAAASQVVVTDPLDTNLNLSKLSVSSIRFGSTDIEIPPGLSSYSTTVDLTSTLNLLVDVSAALTGNTLKVTFTSIDPLTGKPPTDLRGFLPADVHPPEGEGSVTFTIQPKPGLATETKIENSATIVFDQNAPIKTAVWSNTIDNSLPTSTVSSLPMTETSTSFTVQWSGSDDDSGIKDFTIYVSDNKGPYIPWLVNTAETSATFSGSDGHAYAFYSMARDMVGNVEIRKTEPDASTTIQAGSDLSITQSASQSEPVAGTGFTYSITIHNSGPADASGINVTDVLPGGVSFVSGPCTGTTVLTCGQGTLASGATMAFTVHVKIPASYLSNLNETTAKIVNKVSVSSATSDPVPSNNTSSLTLTVTAAAYLKMSMTALPNPVHEGSTLTYNMNFTNTGPSDAIQGTILDYLPPGFTFVGSSVLPCGGGVGVVECDLGPVVPAGFILSFPVQVRVPANYLPPGATSSNAINTATIYSDTVDPHPVDQPASVTTTVVP